jgi:hypothetical protein
LVFSLLFACKQIKNPLRAAGTCTLGSHLRDACLQQVGRAKKEKKKRALLMLRHAFLLLGLMFFPPFFLLLGGLQKIKSAPTNDFAVLWIP